MASEINRGEKLLLEALLARAVSDSLWVELCRRRNVELCPIYVDELKEFMRYCPKLAAKIKRLRSNNELKRCIQRIDKLLAKHDRR